MNQQKINQFAEDTEHLFPYLSQFQHLISNRIAIVHVEEMIKYLPSFYDRKPGFHEPDEFTREFWEEVLIVLKNKNKK